MILGTPASRQRTAQHGKCAFAVAEGAFTTELVSVECARVIDLDIAIFKWAITYADYLQAIFFGEPARCLEVAPSTGTALFDIQGAITDGTGETLGKGWFAPEGLAFED